MESTPSYVCRNLSLFFKMNVGYKIQVKGSISFNLLCFGMICNLKNDKK